MRELLESLDSEELSEWVAFDNLYGLPDGYFVAGLVCSTLANVFGDGKGKRAEPADFIPFFRPAVKPRQSARDHLKLVQSLASRKR